MQQVVGTNAVNASAEKLQYRELGDERWSRDADPAILQACRFPEVLVLLEASMRFYGSRIRHTADYLAEKHH